MRFGVIAPSEVAFRRFMPSALEIKDLEYVGVSYASLDEWEGDKASYEACIASEKEKCKVWKETYGGEIFEGFNALLDADIDFIYIPLPPSLHYKWGKIALEKGKHVFMEKPFTVNYEDTQELILLAKEKNLALFENYGFIYHKQLKVIKEKIGEIGDIRLIRANFCFPLRSSNDFRYKKNMGGGALLDAGGYVLRLGEELMVHPRLTTSKLFGKYGYEVDMYGSFTLEDDSKIFQGSFGMDTAYRCDLEIIGERGSIYTNRIFTAPSNFEALIKVDKGTEKEEIKVEADNQFLRSLENFLISIKNGENRLKTYDNILKQSKNVDILKKNK